MPSKHLKTIATESLIAFALIGLNVGCGNLVSSASKAASDVINGCSGMTLDQVKTQNGLDDSCRSAIMSLLSGFSSNFSGKIYSLGAKVDSTTSQPTLYLSGILSSGSAISSTDLSSATWKVTVGSTQTTLSSSDVTVTSLASSTSQALSVSFVLDYSASMRDADIDSLGTIFTSFFTYAPSIYQAEVLLFSKAITQKLSFSSDKTTGQTALVRDTTVTRASTALYDAVGTAAAHLAAQTNPMRVLFVGTDGLENSSTTYSKDQVVSAVSSGKIFVVALGTLFADLQTLKDIVGTRGVYLWAGDLATIKTNLGNLFNSFGQITKVTLPSTYSQATSVSVTIGTVSANISL